MTVPDLLAATPRVRRPADAATVLSVYLFLLVALPSNLIFHALGAAGTPANVFGMICLVWWLTARVSTAVGSPTGRQPIRIVMAVLAVAIIASYVAAMSRDISTAEINSADRGVLTLLGWSGVALLAADGMPSLKRLNTFVDRMVIGASFLGLLGIIQYTTSWNPVDLIHIPGLVANHPFGELSERSGLKRVTATTSHPIEYGVVMATLLPLTLHYAFFRKEKRAIVRWLPAVLTIAALPMPVARSAVLGAAVALIVLIPTWPRRRQLSTLVVLPIVLVLMRSALPGLLGTLKSLFAYGGSDPSIINRQADYAPAWQYIKEAPLFGRGFQTFLPALYRTLDNAYLGMVIETGVLGLLALIGVQVVGVMSARGARRRSADPQTRDLAQCLAAAAAVPIINLATFDGLGFAMCAGFIFLDAGLCGALWRLTREQYETEPVARRARAARAPRRAVQAVAVLLAVIIAGGVAQKVHHAPGRFYARGTLQLTNPTVRGVNGLFAPADAQVLMETVVAKLDDQTTKDQLVQAGFGAEFRIAIGDGSLQRGTDLTGTGPLLNVLAVSSSDPAAVHTRDGVMAKAEQLLSETQDEAHTIAKRKITATVISQPALPVYVHGSPTRAVAAVLVLLGLLLPLILRISGAFADIVLGRRRRSRTASAVQAAA